MRTPNIVQHCFISVHLSPNFSVVDSSICENGDIRLENGANDMEGRVEICFGGRYGTVCDDNWDEVDAGVVCRQLGFYPIGKLIFVT